MSLSSLKQNLTDSFQYMAFYWGKQYSEPINTKCELMEMARALNASARAAHVPIHVYLSHPKKETDPNIVNMIVGVRQEESFPSERKIATKVDLSSPQSVDSARKTVNAIFIAEGQKANPRAFAATAEFN